MWYDNAVFYQIYPLGLCGCPRENDGVQAHRILRLSAWAEHIRALGATAVLLNPLLDSDRHGYDTRNYGLPDARLGTREDVAAVCGAFHQAGLKVVFDGVFNHVGRGFWAFQDVREKKWDSPYRDWFHLNFDGNSCFGDGFWYEGWEGHYELVKLNLQNPQVVAHQFDMISCWARDYGIDGLRLDVAYSLPEDYLRQLRAFTDSLKPEFFLLGETLHGDYRRIMNPQMCHSVTNYECYKGLYSSFNSMNLFEIGHSLQRQFGPEPWALYRGSRLLSFLDNHDVERIASILQNPAHLAPAYGLLFGMPGIPCLYYGSEWGIEGRKRDGDDALRPELSSPQENDLTKWIRRLIEARQESPALRDGSYQNVCLQNKQIVFARQTENQRVLVAVNADSAPYTAWCDLGGSRGTDLLTGQTRDFGGRLELPPYSTAYWRIDG